MSLFEKFKKYEVKADSIEDFCNRYHIRGALHDMGEDYMQADIESHKEEFAIYGYTIIPHSSSTTGDIVAYYGNKKRGRK